MTLAAYHRPATIEEALSCLDSDPVTIAAGCTDLLAATGSRGLSGNVLDITGIKALRHVRKEAGNVLIGAAATWSDVIAADLPPAFDMLKQAAREVGSVQIQNAGTVAGNICNASPAADGMPCLLAMDAEVVTCSAAGGRVLALADFVTGPRRTALSPGELVTAIRIPATATGGRSRFLKLGARRYLVISIAMVAARLEIVDGRVIHAALSVGACGPVATRLAALEEALEGQPADARLAARVTSDLVAPDLSPIADIRADAPYRLEAATELLRRALTGLLALDAEAAA